MCPKKRHRGQLYGYVQGSPPRRGSLGGKKNGVSAKSPLDIRFSPRLPRYSSSCSAVALYVAGKGLADARLVGVAGLFLVMDEVAPPVDGNVEFLPGVSGGGVLEMLAAAELPSPKAEPLVQLLPTDIEETAG